MSTRAFTTHLRTLAAVSFAAFAMTASAAPYERLDPRQIVTERGPGGRPAVDAAYLDRMLGALEQHARNYPPVFDSEADRRRAVEDAKTLSFMLDMLVKGPAPIPDLLFRAADLHTMAHNLGIDGEAAKADASYKALLALTPNDARTRFAFGAFLGNSARPAEALPHLEKAARGGIVEAHYAMGISYLGLGDAKKAVQQLELYRARRPDDASVGQLIEGIRSGRVKVQRQS